MLNVKAIMSKDCTSLLPTDPISEVADAIINQEVGLVPICVNGKFCGVVNERDITACVVATGSNPKRETANSLLNKNYPKVAPGDSLLKAAKIMANNGVFAIPVVEDGRLHGILTVDDIAVVNLTTAASVLFKSAKEKLRSKL